jgi:hypothetical protein
VILLKLQALHLQHLVVLEALVVVEVDSLVEAVVAAVAVVGELSKEVLCYAQHRQGTNI